MTVETARTEDGIELFVRTEGDGDDVVIVPAAAWLERAFDPIARPGRRVVFYDPQASGRSTAGPPSRLTFDMEVSDMEAVRRHVGAAACSLIGWSYLGAVSALYASRFPDRVRRLVLLCPMPARRGPFDGFAAVRQAQEKRELEARERLEELRRRAEEEPSAETWRAYGLVQHGLAMADPTAIENLKGDPFSLEQEWAPTVEQRQRTLFGTLGDFDWRPLMRTVTARALVVHCELDAPRAVREEWVSALPDARLIELGHTGHFPFLERPRELFDALRSFLDDP